MAIINEENDKNFSREKFANYMKEVCSHGHVYDLHRKKPVHFETVSSTLGVLLSNREERGGTL